MKKLGKASLKRHYGIFVMACLIAAFLGVEFGGSLTFSEAQTYEDTAQQIRNDWYGDGTYTVKTTVGNVSWGTVLRAIAEGDTQAGKDVAQQIEEEEIAQAEEGSPILTRTRGVLASVLNQLSSGSILATLVAAVASITGSKNVGIIALILLGAALAFASLLVSLEGVRREGFCKNKNRSLSACYTKRFTRHDVCILTSDVSYSIWETPFGVSAGLCHLTAHLPCAARVRVRAVPTLSAMEIPFTL